MFGEGGVLFDRLRSATVEVQGGDDRGDLEAWVVSREVFMNEVLPTPELRRVFDEKAFDGKGGNRYIDMDTFVDIVSSTASDSDYIKVQNIYNILRKDEGKHFIGESRIYIGLGPTELYRNFRSQTRDPSLISQTLRTSASSTP